ncbi:MAG: isoprenylcysteine carboxylmethyltransferase family protein [Myxococcota bacterium]
MTGPDSETGAAVRVPPPFVPLIALVIGAVVQWGLGPLSSPIMGTSRWLVGTVLLATGVAVLLSANGHFRRTGQDPQPWKMSPELIGDGIYARTRNPMYLSMGIMQAALGILFANLWIVLFVPATWWVIYRIAIRHEEAYLESRFGDPYVAYKHRVRRWL